MLPTIAILLVGCFAVFVAVLALATLTDGRRVSTVAPARALAARRPVLRS